MCESDSLEVPKHALVKLSLWAALISLALVVIFLTVPLKTIPRPQNLPSPTEAAPPQDGVDPAGATADSAEAPAQNAVWVDADTGVYYRTRPWFSNPKRGQFMPESEAIRAGYKPPTSASHRRF
jgi:hypothetical protein